MSLCAVEQFHPQDMCTQDRHPHVFTQHSQNCSSPQLVMEKENPVCPGSGVYSKIKREWIADADALCVNIENVVVSKGSETQEVVWFLLHKMSLKG